jgi:hypothetical protein
MKNKFGGAAIISGIATIITTFLSGLLNSMIIQSVGYSYGLRYIILALNILETFIAMFVGIKIYCVITKKICPISKNLLVSALAGVVEGVLLSVIALPIAALAYFVPFIVLFLVALIITSSKLPSIEGNKDTAHSGSTENVKRPIANEEMSARAQYAFNEKLTVAKESAVNIDEIVEAKLFAQAVELQLLKAPATARFCALEEMTITINGDMYIVSGYVDSQNSYGATVRTPFKVTVFKENETWKSADKFISMSASIGAQVVSHTIIYWIIGIILSLASFAFFYFIISSQLGI